jgi:hypothetical protein
MSTFFTENNEYTSMDDLEVRVSEEIERFFTITAIRVILSGKKSLCQTIQVETS